jgi:hypothetical protein
MLKDFPKPGGISDCFMLGSKPWISSKESNEDFALDGKAEWERSHGQLKASDRLQGNRHERGCTKQRFP